MPNSEGKRSVNTRRARERERRTLGVTIHLRSSRSATSSEAVETFFSADDVRNGIQFCHIFVFDRMRIYFVLRNNLVFQSCLARARELLIVTL